MAHTTVLPHVRQLLFFVLRGFQYTISNIPIAGELYLLFYIYELYFANKSS